jgi:hypothetical protein
MLRCLLLPLLPAAATTVAMCLQGAVQKGMEWTESNGGGGGQLWRCWVLTI